MTPADDITPPVAPSLSATLDPADWGPVRDLGRQMVDDMVHYLETVRERPVWQTVPADIRAGLDEPLPREGQPLEAVYDQFRAQVLPYATGNIHPRFWGWVMGTGSATAMLAEMLAAGMNSHLAGYDQSATLVEMQVLTWLKALMGFPEGASGVLVSGGTAANLDGLMAARVAKAGYDVREEGAFGGPPLTVYASTETHSWIFKACEAMGLGRRAVRSIPVDADFRIDVAACRAAIAADRAAGLRPFAIVGNAGTVNTGAVDDLVALRALADETGLWLHVDGAFGALAALSDEPELVAGQELADSLAFDLHKWGYLPYEVGVILTRSADAQTAAYKAPATAVPAYLQSSTGGISTGTTYFADRGMALSRGFKALKVWMAMKEQGVARIGKAIQANINQARYLGRQVEADPLLELIAPVSLNVVCFRYRPEGMEAEAVNQLNRQILIALQEEGVAVPSQTILGGRFAIRCCMTNHRSRAEDFDILVAAVRRIGARLTGAAEGLQ